MPDFYIGLMSGTSIDGIDAVLARFDDRSLRLAKTRSHGYPPALRRRLRDAILEPASCHVDETGELDTWVGECFGAAANALLRDAGTDAAAVRAIGSHGQTLRHRPDAPRRFTLQIGNPAVIAAATGIDTIADFRRADVALGGQGAPLVPPFHEWLLRRPGSDRAVANIGGIANLTILPGSDDAATGFDTGPGNVLLDAWMREQRGRPFDEGGHFAASGGADATLLERMLRDPWFALPAPKSTGTEYFNPRWLAAQDVAGLAAADVQATLCELTAASIADALVAAAPATAELFVCGGGAHNADLLARLRRRLPAVRVDTTAAAGLDPDWVEAAAFAWLAKRHVEGLPGSLPAVTGASRAALLGALYPAGRNR